MSVNLIKQLKTWHGKLNCYAVDTFEDLDKLSENELEIIGCRAYCIFNGKFYIMGSDKKWRETVPVFNEVLQKTVTRRGVYSWTFDPNIHDGIQEIEVEFIPTLQEFEETITRTGDYTFRYNKNDYDGYDDITVHFIPTLQEIEEDLTRTGDYEFEFDPENYDGIKKITLHVKPTLQTIEEEINEGGEYEFTFDPENYDGLEKVVLNIIASGNGDKVKVDENDPKAGYLSEKLVSAEGSGIELSINEDYQMEMKFSMQDFEIEYLETLPLASVSESSIATYYEGSISLIASTIIPSYSFSFREGESKFTFYSDSGTFSNFRAVCLRVNDDGSATIIAYSEPFNSNIRSDCKFEVACEWSNGEKIIGGKRYYLGLFGNNVVRTDFLYTFGYIAWQSKTIAITPAFNIVSDYLAINANLKEATIPSGRLIANDTHTVYFGVTH